LETSPPSSGKPKAAQGLARLLSLDAFRGSVMLALASGGLGVAAARHFPGNPACHFLARQSQHAPWTGCSSADLLQPAFLFIVGAALPFAHAQRRGAGQSQRHIAWRAVRRAGTFLLGVFVESTKGGCLSVSFVNVLAQIGLGYVFVTLLAGRGWRTQLLAVSVILSGTWLAFALYPSSAASVPPAAGPSSGRLPGFFAHWNKHDNVAAAFDRHFLNLFPRGRPFVRQAGGYQTLNFIPSMATMLLGVMAGRLLLGPRTPRSKVGFLLAAGLLCGGSGMILSHTVCPCVKRLWTPSWTLANGGGAFLALAGFYWVIDVRQCRRWCLPLAGVGRKTLALYSTFGLIEFLKPLVSPASWLRLDDLLGRVPRGPHALSDLLEGLGLYGLVALTTALLAVLWWIGGRAACPLVRERDRLLRTDRLTLLPRGDNKEG
jgi:predicted acyltransferase